jgi:Fe-S-cluster containining protein
MERTYYPESESSHPWLGPLLDTQNLMDNAVSASMAPHRDKVPCGRGCAACCKGGIVPINNVEARGIRWFVTEQLRGEIRDRVISQLKGFEPGQGVCPFLVDTECGIYAVRPIGCRTFHIIGKKCGKNDNISAIDDKKIYRIPNEKLRDAAQPMLSVFETFDREDQSRQVYSGYLRAARPMRDLDWASYILYATKTPDLWVFGE